MNVKRVIAAVVILLGAAALSVIVTFDGSPASAQTMNEDGELISLQTATPEEGFALALSLSRKGVTETQPDKEVLHTLRPNYSNDPDSLIAASHVVAVHFQTVAAANNYWKD